MMIIHNTSRIKRRHLTYKDIGYLSKGGILDAFDNSVKGLLRVNDSQYDFIIDVADDRFLDVFTKSKEWSMEEKRYFIRTLAQLLEEYNNVNNTNGNSNSKI